MPWELWPTFRLLLHLFEIFFLLSAFVSLLCTHHFQWGGGVGTWLRSAALPCLICLECDEQVVRWIKATDAPLAVLRLLEDLLLEDEMHHIPFLDTFINGSLVLQLSVCEALSVLPQIADSLHLQVQEHRLWQRLMSSVCKLQVPNGDDEALVRCPCVNIQC